MKRVDNLLPCSLFAVATMAFGACNGGSGGTPDGRIGGIDATVSDASLPVDAIPTGPVTVDFVNSGVAVASADVFYQAPDNTVLATVVTDGSGHATATVAAGTSVSIESSTIASSPVALVIEGTKPGDALKLDFPASAHTTLNVSFPAEPNAQAYTVVASCGSGQAAIVPSQDPPTTAIVSLQNCGATADLLLTAFDGNSVVLGSIFAPGVATSADFTFTGAYQPPRTIAAQLSNIATGDTVSVNVSIFNGNGTLMQNHQVPINSDTLKGSLVVPDVPSATWGVLTSVTPAGGGAGRQLVIDTIAPTDSYSLDVGAAALPIPTNFAIDPTTHALTWQQPASADIDFVTAYSSVQRSQTEAITLLAEAPYQAAGVALPVLPQSATTPLLQAGDVVTVELAYYGKVTGGYDSVRANVAGLFNFKAYQSLAVGSRLSVAGLVGN